MNPWMISYHDFQKPSVRLKETLLTLGNGYMATRGAFEDSTLPIHYAGTYLAGVYDRSISTIANQNLMNEDLVNCPNWLPLTFRVEGEDWFEISKVTILSFKEILHLKKGCLKRTYRIQDSKGRIFIINSLRFVSQHNPHLAGIRYSISSVNWSGAIEIRSSLYGNIINNGVPRYQELNKKHLETIEKGITENKYLFLKAKTLQSHLEIAAVATTQIFKNNKRVLENPSVIEDGNNIHEEFKILIEPGQKITIHKLVSIFHSKDEGISEPLYDAIKLLSNNNDFSHLLKNHILAWAHLWSIADVEINDSYHTQQLVRLHIFHTLQSLSKHSSEIDYGAPARGLHGEAYRGHVFWDELFILPFFMTNFPQVARSLLMYRYRRLNAARRLAQENGFQGAMFPWQSASDGEEETQQFHLNPKSGTWGPDFSRYQRHVNVAIVYNIWNYYLITHDKEFLQEYGAELIFEIAKFINSIIIYNPIRNKYEIHGVMGPDEYHEQEVGSDKPGLKNNAYMNIMSIWVLEKALELTQLLNPSTKKYLFDLLDINESLLTRWESITHHLFIPFHEGILSQFEGYEHLKVFDWDYYRQKYSFCERLDRILKAENKNPNEFQISKQPDTLMLFYLLELKEITRLLKQLGYHYDSQTSLQTIHYYLPRTSHGSTLSKITLASILLNRNEKLAAQLYLEALKSDFEDTQGGTTEEGIHLGVMAGTISFLTRNVSGISFHRNYISINPQLPQWIKFLKFKFSYHHNWYEIELFQNGCSLNLCEESSYKCPIKIKKQWVEPSLNKKITISYKQTPIKKNDKASQTPWKKKQIKNISLIQNLQENNKPRVK